MQNKIKCDCYSDYRASQALERPACLVPNTHRSGHAETPSRMPVSCTGDKHLVLKEPIPRD